MISTVLVNIHGLVRPLLLAATLVFAVLGWFLLGRGRTGRRWLGGLALLGVGSALALTLTPDTATRASSFCAVEARLLTEGALDLPNTMLLLPAALFGALWSRRALPVLAATAGLSALIEFIQAALPIGRSCDTDDFIANTLGAAIGVLIAALLLVLHRRRRPRGSS